MSYSPSIAVLPIDANRRRQILDHLQAAGMAVTPPGRESEANLAVVDVSDGEGFESIDAAVKKGVPAIAVVDPGNASTISRAIQLGATDFLDHTALSRELVLRIHQALARQAAAKKAEERAANLQRYEAYFAHVSDGVAILDSGGRILSLNPAGAQLLGLPPGQARGRELRSLVNGGGVQSIQDLLASAASGTPRRDLDWPIVAADSLARTLSISISPLNEAGAAAILSFRDVTASRAMAAELKKTKDFLERLINSSVDAIIAADMRGRIILFNKGAEDICGYRAEEALNRLNVKDLYAPGVAQQVMAQLRDPQIRARGRLGACRQEIIAQNGERVPVSMTASIIYEGERETATVGIFTDLRDRVQLERKLSDVENRLEKSEKTSVIVELAGTAAHELNQPLTSVMGYADLLKRKLKEDDFAFRPVEIIYQEAERMAEIVRKIGKITRYETKSYIGTAKILDLDKASSHEE
jgi:PAS domain S-box-containing protein